MLKQFSRFGENVDILPFVGVMLLTILATPLFLYIHEWGHAFGFWIEGYSPCVGLNNTWPRPPNDELKTLVGGLMGPALSLALGLGFVLIHFRMERIKNWTFAFAIANLVPHPFSVVASVFNLLAGYSFVPVDEALLVLMLPDTSATASSLTEMISLADRSLLLSRWSFLLWLGALLPLSTALILLWKRRAIQNSHSLITGVLIIVVCVFAGTTWAMVATTQFAPVWPSRIVCGVL